MRRGGIWNAADGGDASYATRRGRCVEDVDGGTTNADADRCHVNTKAWDGSTAYDGEGAPERNAAGDVVMRTRDGSNGGGNARRYCAGSYDVDDEGNIRKMITRLDAMRRSDGSDACKGKKADGATKVTRRDPLNTTRMQS